MAEGFPLLKLKKQAKVAYVIHTLEKLYPQTPIPLQHTDPYTLLVAVLLSATVYRCACEQNYT